MECGGVIQAPVSKQGGNGQCEVHQYQEYNGHKYNDIVVTEGDECER